MAIFFALESLKFYKMRNQRFVATFFLIVMLAVFGSLLIQVGDPDFSPLFATFDTFLNDRVVPDEIPLSRGNIIYMAYMLAIILVLELFKYLFASIYIAEVMGQSVKDGLLRMLRYTPSTLLLLIISGIIMGLSSFLMLIPYFWFSFATLFGPLIRAQDRVKFIASLEASYQYTRGNKIILFASSILISLVLRFIEPLIRGFAPRNLLSIRLISAFFMTISMMIQGRFLGMTYIYFVKFFPRMASSFGYRDPREMLNDIEAGREPTMRDSNRDGTPHYPYPHDTADEVEEDDNDRSTPN